MKSVSILLMIIVLTISVISNIAAGPGITISDKPADLKDKPFERIEFADTFPGKIALTFDDGPNPYYTVQILDILKKNNIKATFFVMGRNAAQYPELIKKIVKEGHTLGNHTYNHKRLTRLDSYTIEKELQMTQEVVDESLGYHYELKQVRPPFGTYNRTVTQLLYSGDKSMILWEVDSEDWRGFGEYRMMNTILREAIRGGVIIFHDTQPASTNSLQKVIDELKSRKNEFVTVDDLLDKKYNRSHFTRLTLFNGKLLYNNCMLVDGKPYISVNLFSNDKETGRNWKYGLQNTISGKSDYSPFIISEKALIPVDRLIKNLGVQMNMKDKTEIEFYYSNLSFYGIALNKKVFIYQGELYVSLNDLGDGLTDKEKRGKEEAFAGSENFLSYFVNPVIHNSSLEWNNLSYSARYEEPLIYFDRYRNFIH
jgi:peptidoglycan-N-acetylglucosamine deacetylase